MKKRLISVLFFLIILILISFFSVSATFDQRKDHWLSKYSASDTRKSTHPHFGRTEILSWAEQGINLNNCRSNLESIYDSANAECKDVQADGTYMLCKDEVNNIEFNQEKNEYADLRCLEGNIQSSMTDRWNWPGSMAEVTLTRLLYQYSHVLSDAKKNELRVDINNQFKYMYYFKGGPDSDSEVEIQSESIGYLGALENKDVSMQYSVSGHDYGFTYNGRTYATGQTYNAFELRRDWLYKWFDNVVNSAKTENDGGYMLAPLGGLLLLHDFSERTNDPAGTVMKRKAKMMLDLILLDMLGQHSAGHQGGILGRYYKRNVVDGGFTFPFWHILGEGSDDGQYSDILVSSYRPSGLIESILVVAAKSDDYGHLVLEAGGSSGSKNSMIFVTKNYNLGSSKVQKLWILSVLTDYRVRGNPFSIWINSIHGDADHKNGCGVQECYFKYGNNGYQYKNAILVQNNDPLLHIARVNNEMYWWKTTDVFDEGEDNLLPAGSGCVTVDGADVCRDSWFNEYKLNDGWNYFKKGKTMLAIYWGSSWQAIEVATEGVEYASFSEFQSASRLVSSGRFETGKGDVIEARNRKTYVNGVEYLPGDFSRLEIIDNSGNKTVKWNDKNMTVSKGSKTCTYDFNAWSYSGNGCEGGGNVPLCTRGAVCTTYQNCPGTYDFACACVDTAGDDCPAVVPPPPDPPLNCSVGDSCTTSQSCPGTFNSACACIDNSDDGCPSDGGVSRTCMGHGGSGCTAVVDAWESHLSLGDAYCSTYGRSGFSYCVKCNAGHYNESIQDCVPDIVPDAMPGDLNLDGVVDIIDLVLLVRAFGTSQYDLTGDGNVDVKDLLVIVKKL